MKKNVISLKGKHGACVAARCVCDAHINSVPSKVQLSTRQTLSRSPEQSGCQMKV